MKVKNHTKERSGKNPIKEIGFVFVGILVGEIFHFVTEKLPNYENITVWCLLTISLSLLIVIFLYIIKTQDNITLILKEEKDNITSISETTKNNLTSISNKTHVKLIDCIGIATKFLTNTNDHDKAYEESYTIIQDAKEEILIIGDYAPADQKNELTTDEREKYFLEIERLIKNKITNKDKKKLTYTRIMQRTAGIVGQIKGDGTIEKDDEIEGDEQAFAHCERVLKLKEMDKKEEYTKLRIFVSAVIPSMPSILLVDKKHLLFTIPQKGDNGLKTEAVLHFNDHHREPDLIDTFKNIFNSYIEDAIKLNGFSGDIKNKLTKK